jgi:outer membrane immunogenic protein
MKKLLISGAALAALIGTPALAADMALKAPPVVAAPVHNWTGCYVGAGAGYGMYTQDHQEFFLDGTPDSIKTTGGGQGWLGRVGAGCDYQFTGAYLIGALVDYDWSNIKGTVTTSQFTFPFEGQEKLSSSWAVGARLGWLPMQHLLTYVSGGYTQAHFNAYNLCFNINGACPLPTFNVNAHTRNGAFIGSGFEYELGWIPGLTWKTEYRFSGFRSARDTIFLLPANTPFEFTNSTKYVQTVTTELVWHFWGPR